MQAKNLSLAKWICPENEKLYFSRKILNDGSGRLEFLIDKNGVIISAIDTKKIQKNILDIYGLTKANLSEDFFNLKIDDTTYFATIQTVKNSSLKIISIVPKAFYSEILNIALFESLIIGFVLASVLLISCYFIVSNVYKPIKNIANTFQYHFPENMEEFENEIEYINAKINQTISSKENYEHFMNEFKEATFKLDLYINDLIERYAPEFSNKSEYNFDISFTEGTLNFYKKGHNVSCKCGGGK